MSIIKNKKASLDRKEIINFNLKLKTEMEERVMYAIVESGGKQYKVEPGDIIRVEKLPGNKDDEVLFDKVLFVSDKEKIELGHPFIKDAKVKGKILNQGRSKKVVVFKFRRRKRYHKKRGHRQYLTTVKIENIEL